MNKEPTLHPSGRFRIYTLEGANEIYIEVLQPIGPDGWPEGWEIRDTVNDTTDMAGRASVTGVATACPIEFVKALAQYNPLRGTHWMYSREGDELLAGYRTTLTERAELVKSIQTTKTASEATRQKRREEARQCVELDAPRRIEEAKTSAANALNRTIQQINQAYVNAVTRALSDPSGWDWSEEADIQAVEDQLASVRQNVKILAARATKLKEERIAKYAAQNLHLPPTIDPSAIKLKTNPFT